MLIAQGNPNIDQYAAYCQTLKHMLGMLFTNVEEVVVAAGVRERDAVAKDEALITRVQELGRRVAERYVVFAE